MCGKRAVAFHGDFKIASMQCIDQRVVNLKHGFATSENDKALTLCLAPELKRSVSQRLYACNFAATLARRAVEIVVAETGDSARPVWLPASQAVAACNAQESRTPYSIPTLGRPTGRADGGQ